MSTDTAFVAMTTRYLLERRQAHRLPYVNVRTYDYAFSSLQVIPHVMNQWRTHGLDLSPDFVVNLWEQHANKRADQRPGEQRRAAKLTLDAFRTWYDTQAFAEYGNVQAVYQPDLDMHGQDVQIHFPDGTAARLQLRIVMDKDYSALKQIRRLRRNNRGLHVVDCVARYKDLDRTAQPYLPQPEWYASVTQQLSKELGSKAVMP